MPEPKRHSGWRTPGGGMPGADKLGDIERASLPFSATLSLEPLIEFWRDQRSTEAGASDPVRMAVENALRERPELGEAIADLSLLHRHRAFVDLLMTAVFPPALGDRESSAALVPFESRIFYATPLFYRLFGEEDAIVSGRVKLDVQAFMYNKILAGYLHILRTIYGEDISFEYPTIVSGNDPRSGLERYYKITTDLRFMKIRERGDRPALSEHDRRLLLANLSDLSIWIDLIPPDRFAFYGFTIVKAVDVTDEQVISALRRDLLEGESGSAVVSLETIEKHLQTYLQAPDVRLGLAAIDGGDPRRLERVSGAEDDCVFGTATSVPLSELRGSIFDRTVQHRAMYEIEDIDTHGELAPFEKRIRGRGINSILVAPLFFHGGLIGVVYLWSERPFALNELNGIKLREVLPLFSATVKRSREELRARVQAVILGQYTAIHPSVEWRFRLAALNFIQQQDSGSMPEPEPIVFHDVYPLYGATDIRASSSHRNSSVQSDLLDQMTMIEDILGLARDVKALPILDDEERKAQVLFPHYFEKHQTDGVEYTIYVGGSLNENGVFNPLYLRNLRLWQMMIMCEIARRIERIKPQMTMPLETTHLILTQRTPLSIRFRFDERRFDVDGAYNILFEIMKRRIDKAFLKGDPERLTQPDRIAIVYAQPREAWEYGEYIETLQRWGYLADEVEEVELDDLQGMRGLKALRVQVLTQPEPRRSSTTPDELVRVLQQPYN